MGSIIDLMDMSLSKLWGDSEGQGSLVCCSLYRVAKSWTRLSNKATTEELMEQCRIGVKFKGIKNMSHREKFGETLK